MASNQATVLPRSILAAGGWMHPPDDVLTFIEPMLVERGYAVATVTNPSELVDELDEGCALLVMAACWFSMSQDRYAEADRAEFGVPADPRRQDRLSRLIDDGCPVLGLHTGVICFDDWPGWGERLGGAWNWQRSHHPPPDRLRVSSVEDSSLEIEAFSVVDEEYRDVDIAASSEVVAITDTGHPAMWLHATRGRRVAVDLLGHDAQSLGDPGHQAALGRLLDWLTS